MAQTGFWSSRTRPAAAQECLLAGDGFGFEEEFAESRVSQVAGVRAEDDFRIARQLYFMRAGTMIGQSDPADFGAVLRSNRDL